MVPDSFLTWREHSGYPIYYLGPILDTIRIGRQYIKGNTPWANDYWQVRSRRYSDNTLQIVVDTSSETDSPEEYLQENYQVLEDSTNHYKSFLFYVRNISDSAIHLGGMFSLQFMHREVKDRQGNWIKIERKLSEYSFCTTGAPIVLLCPQDIVISKLRRYSGSFVTDFRLVLGDGDQAVYSNVFRDSIDPAVFEEEIIGDLQ